MKIKRVLTVGLGVIIGSSVSIAGLSYAYPNTNNKVNLITSEKAKSIIMDKVPGATILEFSYDGDDRIAKYDGTLAKDSFEYEIDINAKTGEIIKFEKDNIDIQSTNKPNIDNSSNSQNNNENQNENNINHTTKPNVNYIGEEKAKSIMQEKAPGAKFISLYLDNDSTPKYEGELVNGNIKYEISLDAKTGTVLEFDKEYINYKSMSKDDDDDYDND